MYRPPPAAATTSKDLNLPYPPAFSFGGRRKEEPEAELHHHPSQQQMSPGLLRFRSAPSSLLGELSEDFLPVRPPSVAEADNMFPRFMAPDLSDRPSSHLRLPATAEMVNPVAFSSAPPVAYHSQQQLQMANHGMAESFHRTVASMATAAEQIESGGRNSNLTRQASSPCGFFSQSNEDTGFAVLRSLTGFRNGDLAAMGADAATNTKLKSQLSFQLRQSSLISQISEIGSEDTSRSNHEQGGGAAGGDRCYVPGGAPAASWEDTSLLSANNFSGIKRGREDEEKILSLGHSKIQSHVPGLTHHISLQKTSPEIAAVERFLQFQDAVPCRIRAKRGCATHPRSIAERVRRTKISERMRKLQELVPNMDKQTNTADMLDLAVDYIKDLQKQVKVLTEGRASCTCLSSKQQRG